MVIALDEITINVMNLYTGGLSLSNLFEGPGRFWNTLFVGVVSTFLSAFPVLLDRLVPLTTALGNLFAPLAGVLLLHYLFVAHMRIVAPALFDPKGIYRYWHGVNVTAVIWCFVGGRGLLPAADWRSACGRCAVDYRYRVFAYHAGAGADAGCSRWPTGL